MALGMNEKAWTCRRFRRAAASSVNRLDVLIIFFPMNPVLLEELDFL